MIIRADIILHFFALNLIESYGFGIRRAQNAMKRNHSPELIFEPKNDQDDYTMVTAYINEEFARIQKDESEVSKAKQSKVSDKMSDKMSNKQLLILRSAENMIETQGYATTSEIAEKTDIPSSTVRRHIAKMCETGILKAEGEKKKTKYYRG